MKRLNLSYINVICVFVLSFAVMEYVNLLIGRVGGFPVLAGVLVSYSAMRYGSFARKNMACYNGHLYTDMVYRHGSALYLKILRLGQYQKAWSGAVF